jgi:hypothetical protein
VPSLLVKQTWMNCMAPPVIILPSVLWKIYDARASWCSSGVRRSRSQQLRAGSPRLGHRGSIRQRLPARCCGLSRPTAAFPAMASLLMLPACSNRSHCS